MAKNLDAIKAKATPVIDTNEMSRSAVLSARKRNKTKPMTFDSEVKIMGRFNDFESIFLKSESELALCRSL